jgi:hypothetical protein
MSDAPDDGSQTDTPGSGDQPEEDPGIEIPARESRDPKEGGGADGSE